MSAPGPAETPATDPIYTVRIAIRGDELHLPFAIRAGKDYAIGEDLQAAARRIAVDVVSGKYALGEDATVSIFTAPGPEAGCLDDDDPTPLVWATVYAR